MTIEELKQRLLDGMLEYMREAEPGYTSEHVDSCGSILDSYIAAIATAADEPAARELVREAVLKLNQLNESADEALIETGEREQLWEIITRAGTDRGFFTDDADVTEEWREW